MQRTESDEEISEASREQQRSETCPGGHRHDHACGWYCCLPESYHHGNMFGDKDSLVSYHQNIEPCPLTRCWLHTHTAGWSGRVRRCCDSSYLSN